MNGNKTVRLSADVLSSLHKKAEEKNTSISKLFTAELQAIVEGRDKLVAPEKQEAKKTTLYVDLGMIERLKDIAKDCGVSMDKAIQMVAEKALHTSH